MGSFSDKIGTGGDETSGSYPRFTSYDPSLKLEDLAKGLTYFGGFRLQGLTVFWRQ